MFLGQAIQGFLLYKEANGLPSTQSLRAARYRDKAIALFLLETGECNSDTYLIPDRNPGGGRTRQAPHWHSAADKTIIGVGVTNHQSPAEGCTCFP
jgi:hypothetical protein